MNWFRKKGDVVEPLTDPYLCPGDMIIPGRCVCIKCGKYEPIIKYHTGGIDGEITTRPGRGCGHDDHNRRDDEHLHMYCQCGYDWCVDTMDREDNCA